MSLSHTASCPQGFADGGLLTVPMIVLADLMPPRERVKYGAMFALDYVIGAALGPAVGGILADYATWRWAFYISVPLGSIQLVLLHRSLPNYAPGIAHKLDVLGAGLLLSGIVCALLPLTWSPVDFAWDSAPTISLLCLSLPLLALFVASQRRAHEPLLPLRLFASSDSAISNVGMFMTGLLNMGGFSFLPYYLQLNGYSAVVSGLMMILLVVGAGIATALAGAAVVRGPGNARMAPAAGFACYVLSYALVGGLLTRSTPPAVFEVFVLALGLGIGANVNVLQVVAQNSVHQRYARQSAITREACTRNAFDLM